MQEEEKSAKNIEPEQEDALVIELSETKDKLLRAFAEMDNMSKRCEKEKEEVSKYAISKFAKALLSVSDSLDMAMLSLSNDESHGKAFLDGIRITKSELEKVFLQFNIQKINAIGEQLDPHLHQAIQEEASEGIESGAIIEVLQDGYMISDRVLRPSLVKTAK